MDIQHTLIRACIEGDRRAEHQLFRITYSYLMSICIRYTGQPEKAQEVFNIGFYKILKGLRRYDPKSPFKPWIRTIMINALINEYKKEKIHYKTMRYVENYDEQKESPDINEGLEKFDAEYIYACIAQLPLATQHVFNLYIDGYKHKDIAAMLDINESTSRWHVADAKVRLRDLISNYVAKSNIYL